VGFVLPLEKNRIVSLSSINTMVHQSRGLGNRGDISEVVLD